MRPRLTRREDFFEYLPCQRFWTRRYLPRITRRDDSTSLFSRAWTKIHNVVRALNQLRMVVDYYDGSPCGDQFVKDVDETRNVGEMKACGRFVHYV